MNNKIIFLVNKDSFFLSHRIEIAQKLLADGYKVHIATEFTNYQKKLTNMGFYTHQINFSRNSVNLFKSILPIIQILFLIFRIKPNILHLISLKPIIFGGLISFIAPVNSMVISITGLGSMFIKEGFFFKIREGIFNFLFKIIFAFPKLRVIIQNKDDRNYLIKYAGLKKDKIKMINGSGVDLKRFKFSNIPNNTKSVLMAARIIEDKGVFEFIKAAIYLKKLNFDVSFFLVGDVDFDNPSAIKKSLIERWKKNKIINYFKNQKKIELLIKNSSIVVLPSYREGFPKILMEAAAVGRPVITTNVPGCKDAVINNITGILVPKKNYLALAKAIIKIFNNKNKIKKMGKAARKHAEINFNVIDVVSKHLSIYNSLANKVH